MKKGFIVGKFMPFHNGHIALIEFALGHADTLDVLVCSHPQEPIPGSTRFHWVKDHYRGNSRVKVHAMEYDPAILPDTSVSSKEVASQWAQWIGLHFPGIHLFISSEPYGQYVAESLGIQHLCFDQQREQVPVSATAIRAQPLLHWHYLPGTVQPYFCRKICIVGSESTGKSVLTEKLAQYYKTGFVPEAGRDIVATTESCTLEDLYAIANAHALAILGKMAGAYKLLFIDTDIIITSSYASFLFNEILDIPEWIKAANKADLYLFLETDCAFVQDGTRLAKEEREKLARSHKKAFERHGISYHSISGSWQQRFETAVHIIDHTFFKP